MAVDYTLTDTTWRPRTLARFLEAYGQTLAPKLESSAVERVGNVVRGRLFVQGSVRGAEILMSGRAFRTSALRVRIGMLASRTDWLLAYGLLRALLGEGGGQATNDAGQNVTAGDLTENEAAGLALRRLKDDAAEIRLELAERNRPYAALAGPDYHLIVTRDDLPEDEQDPMRFGMALEAHLAERALRYERAARLPPMAAGDGTPFAYWTCSDALIDAVPFVAMARNEQEEPHVISTQTLFRALGPNVESVSPHEDRFFLHGGVLTPDLETVFKNSAPFHAWAAAHTVETS